MASRSPNRRGAETRSRLLEVGRTQFHRRGFHATGVDLITRAAAVPKGSFYNQFPSKDAFAAEVIDLYFEERMARIRECFANKELPPLERFRGYFHDHIASAVKAGCKSGCLLGNMALEAADHSEMIKARLKTNFDLWTETLEEVITEAQQRGDINNRAEAKLIAGFIVNSWEGALVRMRAESSVRPLEEASAMIFATVLA